MAPRPRLKRACAILAFTSLVVGALVAKDADLLPQCTWISPPPSPQPQAKAQQEGQPAAGGAGGTSTQDGKVQPADPPPPTPTTPPGTEALLEALQQQTGFSQLFVRRVTTGGTPFWMVVYPPDKDAYVSGTIWGSGHWDNHITTIVKAMVGDRCRKDHDGHLFVDVGQHIGYFGLLASSLGCRVIGFEPQPGLYAMGEVSKKLNSFNEFITYNAPLAEKAGQGFHFNLDPKNHANLGGVFLSETTKAEKGATSVTLDETLGGGEGPVIPLMKVDVEGFEKRAFAGAEKLFESQRVRSLIMEIHPERQGGADGTAALLAFLRSKGFAIYRAPDLQGQGLPGGGSRLAEGSLRSQLMPDAAADKQAAVSLTHSCPTSGFCSTDIFATREDLSKYWG